MTRPPFPAVVDNTLLETFRDCPQKAYRLYFEHWKARNRSIHLHAGKAFAAGLEAARIAFYIEGKSPEDSTALGLGELWRVYGDFQPGPDDVKDPYRMAGALEFYFACWPLGQDRAIPNEYGSRRGIEFSFLEPLPINHPETGDPLLLSGRLDLVARNMGGVFSYDEKTTSQLGASWMKQWELRSQFTGYAWGLMGHNLKTNGTVVRGIAILKSGYNKAEVITYRSQHEIDRWLEQTVRDLQRMIRSWEEGYWDFNLGHACSSFGGCPFVRVCKSKDPYTWLQQDFERRRWDPVLREEFLITEPFVQP